MRIQRKKGDNIPHPEKEGCVCVGGGGGGGGGADTPPREVEASKGTQ